MSITEVVARALARQSFEAQGNDKPGHLEAIVDRRWPTFVPQAQVALAAIANELLSPAPPAPTEKEPTT